MKKIIVVLAFILVAMLWNQGLMPYFGPAAASEGDVALLSSSLSTIGAQPTRAVLNGWCPLPTVSEPQQMAIKAEAIAGSFGLYPADYDIVLRSTGEYSYAVLEHQSEQIWARIQVQYVNKQSFATIDVRLDSQDDIDKIYQNTLSALSSAGPSAGSVIITACLEGTLDARLREGEKLDLLYSAFHAVNARYHKGSEIGGLAVWSGYSPRFSLSAGTQESNISLSLRYDETNQQTVVRVATPVLPGSY